MKKALKTLVCLAVFSSLAACGGSDSAPPPPTVTVTTPSITAPINTSTVAAVVGTPFSFSGGVPAFGTTLPTTVSFTGTGTTPAFSISTSAGAATGSTTFGSCIFQVISSTFPADSPLATGKTVRVDPCSLNVNTANKTANGTATPADAVLALGTLVSLPNSLSVSVAADGSVTISGTNLGSVTVKTVTGGS